MRHLLSCLWWAAKHPVASFNGVREFRSDFTKHYEPWQVQESYDAGRELAHIFTFRQFEN